MVHLFHLALLYRWLKASLLQNFSQVFGRYTAEMFHLFFGDIEGKTCDRNEFPVCIKVGTLIACSRYKKKEHCRRLMQWNEKKQQQKTRLP
jgi:hypothetical protein